jgi:uncharacterized protein (DUF1800 family)
MNNSSVHSINTPTPSSGETVSNWQIPHLLRRAGFGASPDELANYEKLGLSGSIDSLLNYENIDDSNLPAQPNITMAYTIHPTINDTAALIWWWVDRMARTPRPLEEKMTLFWHNHFATGIYKVRSPYLMFKQNQLLRTNAMGSFQDLLLGVTKDPAMLIWLDGARNRKDAPNENYGREVMEVFTTGRGVYTEDDVKAAARAFTGYTLDKNGNAYFNPKLHDDGTKTFLGHTGNLGPEDVVQILANHPATAKNIATELFQYFAYDSPTTDIIDRLAQIYADTNGNIKAVVEAILKSDEFISEQSYLAQVKSPVEYVVTSLRSLGGTVPQGAAVSSLNNMGQLPFDPPSVFGWPSGMAWINTSSILDRINFPLSIQKTANVPTIEISRQVTGEQANNYVEMGAYIDNLGRMLFPEGLPQEVVQTIDQSTNTISNPQDRARTAIRLIMASPFYNLN